MGLQKYPLSIICARHLRSDSYENNMSNIRLGILIAPKRKKNKIKWWKSDVINGKGFSFNH
jgi:hypothetical protein